MDSSKYCALLLEGKMDRISNPVGRFTSSVCTSSGVSLKQRNGKETIL